jgi:hypothetical protein
MKISNISGEEWGFKDSSVRIGRPRNHDSFPGRGEFSFLLSYQSGSGAKLFEGGWGLFKGDEEA